MLTKLDSTLPAVVLEVLLEAFIMVGKDLFDLWAKHEGHEIGGEFSLSLTLTSLCLLINNILQDLFLLFLFLSLLLFL